MDIAALRIKFRKVPPFAGKDRLMTADLTIISGPGGCEDEIAAITEAAFAKAYGSGAGEAALIRQLRADGDVVVELTALGADGVLGHVMFSRLTVSPPGLAI